MIDRDNGMTSNVREHRTVVQATRSAEGHDEVDASPNSRLKPRPNRPVLTIHTASEPRWNLVFH